MVCGASDEGLGKMKRRGRRGRRHVEIIPYRPHFWYDAGRDLYMRIIAPVIRLTAEQRAAIGEFANLKGDDPEDPAFLDQIFDRINQTLRGSTSQFKVIVAARNTFAVMADLGFPHYRGFVETLDPGLDKIGAACRQQIVRHFLTDRTLTDQEVREIIEILSSQIEAGLWPNWREEYEREIEAAQVINSRASDVP
jgi:hypothetical protein